MSFISKEYIDGVLSKIASEYGLREWSYKIQTFKSIAQNYFGVLIPITLEGERDGKLITLHLVLKLAPPDEMYRVSGAVTVMFAREIFVYSELLQKYLSLQDKLSEGTQQSHYVTPRCYFVCKEYCEEVIAMENMCFDGYSPYTERFLDLDHIIIALKELAKFHALSFILKEKDSVMYEKAKKICVPLTNKSNSRYLLILKDRLVKALTKFENTCYVSLLEALKSNCDYFIESVINNVNKICICHGDMWKENLLFKYKDNVPVSACIIDYQTTRLGSPAFDVLYLIVSSVHSSLRMNNYNNLIDQYYESFRQFLLLANLDSEEVLKKKDFEHDLSICGPACLIVANTAIWLSSGLQEEGHVRSKYQPITEVEKLKAVDQYKAIIKDVIDDLTVYGYLKIPEIIR